MGREHRTDYGEDGETPLDDVDRRLLALLQSDAKRPLAALGDEVDLAPSSVAERVRRLEATGVIRGYFAQVDPRRVGLDLAAFIGVSLNYPKHIDEFEAIAIAMPEVQECHRTGRGALAVEGARAQHGGDGAGALQLPRHRRGAAHQTMVVFSTRIERAGCPSRVRRSAPA
ncbi:MAG: Lrp/AsnC family transcriptional regulator [Polyangiales bacterium]